MKATAIAEGIGLSQRMIRLALNRRWKLELIMRIGHVANLQ